MPHNIPTNVDLPDVNDDWGHFVSTDGIDMNYNGRNYNLHNYNARNCNIHNCVTHNCNVHDRDVNKYECMSSSCLPIIASVCIIGTIILQTTLKVCWQVMP
jgi:hypothetical protein